MLSETESMSPIVILLEHAPEAVLLNGNQKSIFFLFPLFLKRKKY